MRSVPFLGVRKMMGVFDGNNKTIKNLLIIDSFVPTPISFIEELEGSFLNTTVEGHILYKKIGYDTHASLVGITRRGSLMSNIISKVNVEGTLASGLVYEHSGELTHSYSEGTIVGIDYILDGMVFSGASGLVANNYGKIFYCYNLGDVVGLRTSGLALIYMEYNLASPEIKQCYSLSDTSLVHRLWGLTDEQKTITNSYTIWDKPAVELITLPIPGAVISDYLLYDLKKSVSDFGSLDTLPGFDPKVWKIKTVKSVNGVSRRPVLIGIGEGRE